MRDTNPARIAVVADDLTGAADTAAGMAAAEIPAFVTWAPHVEPAVLQSCRLLAIDAGTRALPAIAAAARIAALVTRLRAAGFDTLYKKVDSTLRGHIAAEVEAALAAWHPHALAVVALAFPATGRTTVGGRQLVDNLPLPCPSILDILERGGVPAVHATLADVRSHALERAVRLVAGRRGALVCDAETDDDLVAIAAAGAALAPTVLWVGSGGLARALAARRSAGVAGPPPRAFACDGPVLTVVGSANPRSRAQVAPLVAAGALHVPFPGGTLADFDRTSLVLADTTVEHLRRGNDLVITIEGDGALDPAAVEHLGLVLRPCVQAIGGLIATGGDTAAAILRAWGVTGLDVVAEVEPGVPVAVARGVRRFPAILKAGGFGHDRSLQNAREALRRPAPPAR